MHPPIEPRKYTTAREMLAGGYRLSAYCRKCDRWAQVDLARMVREGRGDVRLIPVRLTCRVCGDAGEGQLQPTVPGSPGYGPHYKPGGGP